MSTNKPRNGGETDEWLKKFEQFFYTFFLFSKMEIKNMV